MADQTESRITIDAPQAAVMAVIADLTSYPEWAGGVKSVEVLTEYDDGRPGDARFSLDSGPIKDSYVLAYEWEGDDAVSWTMGEPGSMVSGMDGRYELTPSGDSTEVVYKLAVDVKIPMLGMIKRKAEKTIVDTALKGLKKRVEG
jgi:carbon monoxide dehydrogenase subunit G